MLIFPPLRRRRSPHTGAFFTPADLTGAALLHAIVAVASDLIAAHSATAPFQRRNSRSLIRKVNILAALFESLQESAAPPHSPSATTCFREFYILVHRARILLDYCSQSGRLCLLLQNPQASGHFHDLNQEISTLLDVLPLADLKIPADVREQVELLRRQSRGSRLYVDPDDEVLRLQIFSFLDDFERGRAPDPADLRAAFVDRLGISDARACRTEIELLEEQIYNQEEDSDPSVLGGVVALARYCRFLIFGFQDEDEIFDLDKKGALCRGFGEASITVPKDFCCPISLDLMRDPVITSTGQTYDRASITHWMDEGHITCPNSGLMLSHTRLVPNLALRNLIAQWCAAYGVPCDPPDGSNPSIECMATVSAGKAAVEANRATAEILVRELSDGADDTKTIAARELRLMAKTGKENRAHIADAGAIPLLRRLLCSSNAVAQENSVTAILNLSIHESNKIRVMEEEGCLTSIVHVLRNGWTTESRENAAATLFSLSAVHDYKKRIADESGALEALAVMLRDGSLRGKKDAVTALFNLSTHAECCQRMVESCAVSALVGALETDGVAEDAAGALAILVRRRAAAEAITREELVVEGLVGLMRRGSPRGKESAVAVLLEMCRIGGAALTQRVARTPALGGLIQTLLFTGTKRARRKAASLARICQRSEAAAEMPFAGGWGMEYPLARSDSVRRSSSFVGSGDVSVSVSVSVSVPVAISVPVT